jgi:hypothetical protein
MVKIRDWSMIGRVLWASGAALLFLLLILVLIMDGVKGQLAFGSLAALAVIISLCALFAKHLQGVVLDIAGDTLEFPTRIWRTRVLISEVHDANFETASVMAPFGKKKYREYRVNLSGDFGSRQVRFATKAKRDEFASALRRGAPMVRISRWY